MRTHHHEDCIECVRGFCDGSTWVDPDYPANPGPDPWLIRFIVWLFDIK